MQNADLNDFDIINVVVGYNESVSSKLVPDVDVSSYNELNSAATIEQVLDLLEGKSDCICLQRKRTSAYILVDFMWKSVIV